MDAAQVSRMMRKAAADGLTELAEHVQRVTRARTPNDPATGAGDLSDSIAVEPATEGNLESAVYTDSEYAIYQHENLRIAHPTGQSKFLESAALESARDAEGILGVEVRKHFG
jgi:hypothetical protein